MLKNKVNYIWDNRKNILLSKTVLNNGEVQFSIYDTSRSIFIEYEVLKTNRVDRFKCLGVYSFDPKNELDLFKKFLNAFSFKFPMFTHYNGTLDEDNKIKTNRFFSLNTEDIDNLEAETPQFLKLHVSSDNRIANFKMKEFLERNQSEVVKQSGSSVTTKDWTHKFIGITSKYNLDGLKINEVELDTSVILNLDKDDENLMQAWNNIKADLMATRH